MTNILRHPEPPAGANLDPQHLKSFLAQPDLTETTLLQRIAAVRTALLRLSEFRPDSHVAYKECVLGNNAGLYFANNSACSPAFIQAYDKLLNTALKLGNSPALPYYVAEHRLRKAVQAACKKAPDSIMVGKELYGATRLMILAALVDTDYGKPFAFKMLGLMADLKLPPLPQGGGVEDFFKLQRKIKKTLAVLEPQRGADLVALIGRFRKLGAPTLDYLGRRTDLPACVKDQLPTTKTPRPPRLRRKVILSEHRLR